MSQAPFFQPKARGQALHRQILEGLQHVDLYDCIYTIISSGIQYTEEYINKPLMSLILRFTADQKNTSDQMNTTDPRNTTDQRNKPLMR